MYETFYTIIQTSSGALYPDKFRTERDRKRLTVVNQVMWFLGLMSGILLPGIFIGETATRDTLSSAALWLAIISLVGMLLMLPGVRETPEMIARNERTQTEKQTIGKFFKTFGRLLRNKNFLGYFFVTLGMAILQALIITSVPYIVLYIVQAPESFLFTYSIYIQISYAVAAVLFVPLWILLQRKYPYQKLYKVAFLIIPVGLIPFIFVSNIWIFVGGAFIIGIGIGGLSVLGARMFWDVIDESCAECGERQEGAYSSIFTFLQRIGPIIGTGFFALIQLLTGFIPGQEDITGSVTYVPVGAQPASAFLGIRLIISVIPIVVALLGFLIFQLIYKLDPDKVKQNVKKLKELGI
jgi:GPH family glycoside/pentoside/hexuronide:cation symporter